MRNRIVFCLRPPDSLTSQKINKQYASNVDLPKATIYSGYANVYLPWWDALFIKVPHDKTYRSIYLVCTLKYALNFPGSIYKFNEDLLLYWIRSFRSTSNLIRLAFEYDTNDLIYGDLGNHMALKYKNKKAIHTFYLNCYTCNTNINGNGYARDWIKCKTVLWITSISKNYE